MPYFVRKINKLRSVELMRACDDIDRLEADAVSQEFRTTNNTLSIWKVESFDDVPIGMVAIALSSARIDSMDFLVISSSAIESSGLEIEQTSPGSVPNPLKTASEIHYDIKNLYLRDFKALAELFVKSVGDDNSDNVIACPKSELCEHIKDAAQKGLIDPAKANEKIKSELDKLGIK